MQSTQSTQNTAPSFVKLGACLIYEALVIIALSLICTSIYVFLFGDATTGIRRYLLQLFLWLAVGVYFVWCWHKSGQTLAMQTWQFKIVGSDNQSLTISAAIVRYVCATTSLLLFGLGFFWAILDSDRLYLHDRVLKNKLIVVPRKKAS